MEVNMPVWNYYGRNDEYITDPLYIPYQRERVSFSPDETCEVNMFKKQGYCDGFVNPALVRKGWGLSFQLLHPETDSCPEGWTKGIDGWCVASKPEFEGTFYTDKAHVAKYQYHNGYTLPSQGSCETRLSQFVQKSVNPTTGNYNQHYLSKPGGNSSKYNRLPSKDSYLA